MDRISVLTPREREVAELLARCYSNKQAAKRLRISVRTVEHYREIIMDKLGIKTMAELWEIMNPAPVMIVLTGHPENTTVMVGEEVLRGFYED